MDPNLLDARPISRHPSVPMLWRSSGLRWVPKRDEALQAAATSSPILLKESSAICYASHLPVGDLDANMKSDHL